jgi:hypothetical protein
MKDGAYTVASSAEGVEEKFSRMLAGHAFGGSKDNYVARKPKDVKPACDAVYAHYFGK